MRSATHSVRPPNNSIEVGGGLDAKVGEEGVRRLKVVIVKLLVDPYSRWRMLKGQLLMTMETT